MEFVRWLLTLGTTGATANAGRVLDARRREEAGVDALATRLERRIPTAA
jgi:hypothetical protein